jgi:trk system potassium uptake protein TrkH
MHRYFPVLTALGLIITIFGLLMFFPLLVSLYLDDGAANAYYPAILFTCVPGMVLWLLTRSGRRDLRPRDGFLLVALTWVIMPVFGALPLLGYLHGLSFTHAYFEAVSGLSATGASMLSGVDALPTSVNLWRTFLHWIGGMGVIVLVVAILPLLGIGGRQMFKAEVPSPMKESSLTPRITETAKGLWLTYVFLTVACGVGLYLAGMGPWDALIHAFSITGLGGFSSKDASLAHFNSVPIEMVTIVFALLAGLNYATHYLALLRRSPSPYRQDPEIPFYFGVLIASIALLTVYLMYHGVAEDWLLTLRYVAFQVVSISTSLGLTVYDHTQWPMFVQLWVLFLGSFVACSGSTGGGIKMMRAMILYKQVYRELVRSLHPQAVQPMRVGIEPIPEGVLHAVLGFSFMYVVSIVTLTLIMSATGVELITAFSAVVACLNNTGPGLGDVGPMASYAGLSDFQIWLLAFTMILGRLEIFTLLVVLVPVFWRR